MKIALVTNTYAPSTGGLETYLGELASGLVAAGDEVVVCTQSSDRAAADYEETSDGVIIRRFRSPTKTRHYAFAPAPATHLRQFGRTYDVIHAHNHHGLPALVAARFGQPLVFSPYFHGTKPIISPRSSRGCRRDCSK